MGEILLGWPSKLKIDEKLSNKSFSEIEKRRYKRYSYLIKYQEDGHLVTFAPTGSGKGVSAIIPNLLHYSGPTIVIDPKGENFEVTAKYRQECFSQKIYLLDPFHRVRQDTLDEYGIERSSLNPLSLALSANSSIDNDSQMLAELFSNGGTIKDPYWDNAAKNLLSGVIAYVMHKAKATNLEPQFQDIVDFLFGEDIHKKLSNILEEDEIPSYVKRSLNSIYQTGAEISITFHSILSIVQTYLSLLTTDELLECFNMSTFSLNSIQKEENYTIYIVIPPNKLESHAFILKVWISTLLNVVMERDFMPSKRTLFILDECANLGQLSSLKKAVTLLRGYGLQVWMFFQDMAQVEDLYPIDYKTMINNCGVLQAFGFSRMSAAAPLAKTIGKYSEEELLNLDKTQQIISIAPGNVYISNKMKYFSDTFFKGKSSINSLIKSSKETKKILSKINIWDRKRRL